MLKLNVFPRLPRRRRPVATARSLAVVGAFLASTAFSAAFASPRPETDDFDDVPSGAEYYDNASYNETFYEDEIYVDDSVPEATFVPPVGAAVGSDAFLDAATVDVFARREKARAEKERKESTGLFGYPVETAAKDGDAFRERWIDPDSDSRTWTPQILPQGLMYPSYLAGRKEPRLQSVITYDDDYGTLWDITLGGRAPIFRYGTTDAVDPEGWELELEGAALLRLDWERNRNLAATDYRAGVPLVYGTKRWRFKTGYYHVSSHLGDNYLMDKFRPRVHYSRDAILFGLAFKPTEAVRIYAEADLAFHTGETTDPMELQFGFEYAPPFNPNISNWTALPFLATHAHLYEERDFGGYFCAQTGLQWRSASNSLLRLGFEYFNGGDDLYQFHRNHQCKYGVGLWYDF
ncbi:MAG: DUF1207 domain-containing protein [Thermoguttaceae bacterium]|nr:DUF1207 domain-containing protein [Thermoguttaceae bacterium]